MRRRQLPPVLLPKIWLMTDERIDDLPAVVAALPRGGGVVFRHYSLPSPARAALFAQVRRVAVRRQLTLVVAGPPLRGSDGRHNAPPGKATRIHTAAVHNARELRAARQSRADLLFVSPVFATRSHPNAKPLGVARLGLLLGSLRSDAIALGGMNARNWRHLRALGLHGWAAIGGLSKEVL